ncbi:MAG: protein translocase subunit SecD [Granulosicoccus sp.]
MINTNPLWKILLLAAVLLSGALFALPNLFGSDPAVQVSGRNTPLDENAIGDVKDTLAEADFSEVEFREKGERLLALFNSEDEQIRARDVLQAAFDRNETTVALNLESASPGWLRGIAAPMNLGLDLRGGVHFLMEVDMQAAIDSAEERFVSDWKRQTRKEKIRGSSIQHDKGALTARFKKTEDRDRMLTLFREDGRDLDFVAREKGEFAYIDANLTKVAEEEERNSALQQNIVTLRNRVNELGVAEPVIQQQGQDRIVVQLPGVQDTGRAKEILGATATLEYRLVATDGSGRAYKRREDGSTIMLDRDIIVTGDQIKDASAGIDQQSGSSAVFVNLDSAGARRMQEVTQDNVGNLMAVVYIENQVETRIVDGETIKKTTKVEEVINAATIRDVLSHRFQTTGLGAREASNLALLLRAGALKAPVQIVEERTIGPSLGKDNIRQGFLSAIVGLALVVAFMTYYYRVFGMIAGAALVINVVLIVAVLGTMQATLTLPGIAGIVLTTGMAVDANVLIFERIREELKSGAAVQAAISAGYEKAFTTIADANITTLIAAIVLFSLGTGPVKGFAITLCIGILTSMFTAIFGSRVVVNALYGGRRMNTLPI